MIIFISSAFGWMDWKTIKTDDFIVFYKPGYENEALEVLNILEYYRKDISSLTGNRILHVPIVIEDIGQVTNGYTDPVFYNIHIYTYPPGGGELGFLENWWREVAGHEYTHMTHLTNAKGVPGLLSSLFGNEFAPNLFLPLWMMEGIAVYSESARSLYEGRLNDGSFDAILGAKVSEDTLPSISDVTYTPPEYPFGTIPYLYGSEFTNYLAEKYGKDKLPRFYTSYGSSILSYLSPVLPFIGMDRTAKTVFGKTFPELFDEWRAYEKEKYRGWKIDGKMVTHNGWNITSPMIRGEKLYYIRNHSVNTSVFNTFNFNEIVEKDLETGRERVVTSTTSHLTRLYISNDDKLYYTVWEEKKGYANATSLGFGIYSLLCEKDLKTGKDKTLFGDAIRTFTILDDDKILYAKDRKHTFGSEVWEFYKDKRKKLFDTDYLILEMTSEGNNIAVSARKDWHNAGLFLLNVKTNSLKPLVNTPYYEGNISLNGKKLFFTANYNGVYGIFCCDLLTKKIYRLTNGGYAVSPAYDSEKNLLYFIGINSNGTDIYQKAVKFSTQSTLKNFPSPVIPMFHLDKKDISYGDYLDDLKTLFPAVRIPLLFYSDERKWGIGAALVGGDAVNEVSYNAVLAYDTGTQHLSTNVGITSAFFAPLITDLSFDTTDASPSLSLGFSYPLIVKMNPGMSQLWAGVSIRMKDVFKHPLSHLELIPLISTSLRFPTTRIDIGLQIPLERKALGNDIDRTGYYAGLSLQRCVNESEINLGFNGFYDPDSPTLKGYIVRGYNNVLASRGEIMGNIEYSLPLLKIRKGIWNPNIYLEDAYLKIFMEGAFNEEGERRVSIGAELSTGVKLLFGSVKLAPTVGIAVNGKNEVSWYYRIEF